MNKMKSQRLAALLAAGMATFGPAAFSLTAAWGQSETEKKTTPDAGDAMDRVIMRDGRILEGRILKETPKELEFQLIMAGGLTATRTIDRSEILDIKKGSTPEVAEGEKKTTKTAEKGAATAAPAAAGTKVYIVPLKGEFQRDVALTPMKRVMEDAKRAQPDILIFRVDCEFKVNGQEIPEWADEPGSFDQLELARQIDPLITDAIREDPEWKVKPRLVFWVQKALGGVAFLPFLSPELYYASTAKHGGIGYLDYLFEGIGDDVVREKQRSLRLGRAQGLALKGGHPVEILTAMARVDYVLSVNFVGGRPEFHEDTTGEVLLTDDGDMNAGRRDTVDDVLRFTGNDVLTLTADMAQRLGMSDGTVDSEDQLFEKLGIARSNPIRVGKAKALLEEWSKGVTEAEFAIRRLWRDFERVTVREPGGWNERTAARGKQKAILKDILSFLEKYGESISPYEIRAMPGQMITRVKLMIDEVEQAQRRDKDK